MCDSSTVAPAYRECTKTDRLYGEKAIPKIIFNDEALEANAGETLLAVARRHSAHVWFLCDGRGLCRTCECRVLSGGENLSPATGVELEVVSESRRRSRIRLACQTQLTDAGDAAVISLAEQMRREATEFITLRRGVASTDSLTELINDAATFASSLIGSLPNIAGNALPQLIDAPPTISRVYGYLRDAGLMIERILSHPLSTGKK
jgi:ferredoxin